MLIENHTVRYNFSQLCSFYVYHNKIKSRAKTVQFTRILDINDISRQTLRVLSTLARLYLAIERYLLSDKSMSCTNFYALSCGVLRIGISSEWNDFVITNISKSSANNKPNRTFRDWKPREFHQIVNSKKQVLRERCAWIRCTALWYRKDNLHFGITVLYTDRWK